jgi:GrpB-like predicted nucleotidyltransferase (UPF0157 family)
VEVFRFDSDIAMSLGTTGSLAKLGQLVGNAALAQAGVLYLKEGARFSPQDSSLHKFLAITAGSCTVNAETLAPFTLRSQQAVAAEPHEKWTVTALETVVGLWFEGSFDVWAVAVTKVIIVIPYDEEWPNSFNRLSEYLWQHVGDVALRIDHVGSSAVPGLAGKPIIDIDIVASQLSDVDSLVQRLEAAGYRWRGNLGVEGREAFSPANDSDFPEHHLYVVVENNRAHLDHLLLRDLLREDHQAREEYADLKTSNAVAADGNMDIYVAAKATFVANMLARARRERGLPPVAYWKPE